ncbi:MAG TPA: glycosyltransferase family 2 protein [Hyphomicrobium sp.]|jgi:glycosyltransferase involved in cell wall biosynthesis
MTVQNQQADEAWETSSRAQLDPRPVVSVLVVTFNHEQYLRRTVESIVEQHVSFPLEVVIAEDHSTDGTFQIALQLQQQYPNITRIIHGPKNLGMIGNGRRGLAHCRGDYIATCDGDDYWTDPYKLNRQITEMRKRPEVGVCFTRGVILHADGRREASWNYGLVERLIKVKELLDCQGMLVPTASLLWRAERLRRLPSWFWNAPVGDIFMLLAGAMPAGVLYLPDITVAYRVAALGNWSSRQNADWRELRVAHSLRMLQCYESAVVSFGLERAWFRRLASGAHYVLMLELVTKGEYSAAFEHLREIAPRYFVSILARRFTESKAVTKAREWLKAR